MLHNFKYENYTISLSGSESLEGDRVDELDSALLAAVDEEAGVALGPQHEAADAEFDDRRLGGVGRAPAHHHLRGRL